MTGKGGGIVGKQRIQGDTLHILGFIQERGVKDPPPPVRIYIQLKTALNELRPSLCFHIFVNKKRCFIKLEDL